MNYEIIVQTAKDAEWMINSYIETVFLLSIKQA